MLLINKYDAECDILAITKFLVERSLGVGLICNGYMELGHVG